MFIPRPFHEEDKERLHALMRQNEFAMFVTVRDGLPFVTHLPVRLDTGHGEWGTLRAHLARANPQWEQFGDGREALVIFQGPHAYVSPSWYAHHPAVPTWNYAVVHAWGTPRLLGEQETAAVLREITDAYEGGPGAAWTFAGLPEEYREKMARGVVGFEMPIARMEGKFKLSQNRPVEDQARVAAALCQGGAVAQETARLMRERRETGE